MPLDEPAAMIARLPNGASPHAPRLRHEDPEGARVYDVARETPLELAPKLSSRLGSEVWLKREDLQPVILVQAPRRLQQARVAHRGRAGTRGHRIVRRQSCHRGWRSPRAGSGCVPSSSCRRRRRGSRWRRWSGSEAEVVLAGEDYDGAKARADALAAERGMIFVPPFDDEHVIAGQGTVGDGDRTPARRPARCDLRRGRRRRAHRRDLRTTSRRCGRRHGSSGSSPTRRPPCTRRSRREGASPWSRSGSSPTVRGGATDRGRAVPDRTRVRRRRSPRHHTTRSVPRSRTSSRTRARSRSRPARSGWPA